MGPREVVTGRKCDYDKHCQLQYGEYVQVFDQTSNDALKRRTTAAIAMCPNGNVQGGHLFFSLRTGRRLNRYQWTKIAMPDEVIAHVEKMAGNVPAGIRFGDDDAIGDESNTDDDESIEEDDSMSHDDVEYDKLIGVPSFTHVTYNL